MEQDGVRTPGQAPDALRFHRAFLKELGATRGLDYVIKRFAIAIEKKPGESAGILLVMPRKCDTCGRPWRVGLRIEQGVKCERLEADLRCSSCGRAHTVSFCLPEV